MSHQVFQTSAQLGRREPLLFKVTNQISPVLPWISVSPRTMHQLLRRTKHYLQTRISQFYQLMIPAAHCFAQDSSRSVTRGPFSWTPWSRCRLLVPLCRTAGLKVTVDWLAGETRRYAHESLSMVGDFCPGHSHDHFPGTRLSTPGCQLMGTFTGFRACRFANAARRATENGRRIERGQSSESIDEIGADRLARSRSKSKRTRAVT